MVMGHLTPGVTASQAAADLSSIGSSLEKTYPKEDGQMSFTLERPGLYGHYLGGPVRAFVSALMLLAGLILLAACANLGSLFAARASDRAHEVALRLALGASRSRILRQLFTEALLISLAGGAVGLWGSLELLRWLEAWQPFPQFPINVPVNPDAKLYGVALLLALVSAFLFGAAPVRQILGTQPYGVIKLASTAGFGRRFSVRDLLLAVQIAICAVLLTSSMVAVRGMLRSLHSDFGFEPRNSMLVDTDLGMAGYAADKAPEMQKRILNAIQAIPGVTSVGLIFSPPLANGRPTGSNIFTDTSTDLKPGNAAADAFTYSISPKYFQAAGTNLLAGRDVSWHDDKTAARVAVINQEFARKVFGPVGRALGAHFKMPDGTRIQVVGVVQNGKYASLTEDQQLAMFSPILQSPSSQSSLVVRSKQDPRQLADAIRSKLRQLDRGLATSMQTREEAMNFVLFPARVATVSLSVLGVMGALLSISGIFGMAAYSLSKRLKELGIRLALGAQRKEVLEAALGRAFKLLGIGSAAGLILGILASRVLGSIVYEATPRDPLVLGGVVLVMLLLGLVATWIPAQRALSLDPMKLLRED
jgi:predicted permease